MEEHDAAVLDSIRERVTSGDVLWVLGDLTVSEGAVQGALDELAALECADIRFVSGNHDPVWAGHRDTHKWLMKYLAVCRFVGPFARIKLAGVPVLLSHFPYQNSGDHTREERYAQYRLPDLGGVLVHGHTHSQERLSTGPGGGLQICVCWEAWRRPVSSEEIVEMITGDQPLWRAQEVAS